MWPGFVTGQSVKRREYPVEKIEGANSKDIKQEYFIKKF